MVWTSCSRPDRAASMRSASARSAGLPSMMPSTMTVVSAASSGRSGSCCCAATPGRARPSRGQCAGRSRNRLRRDVAVRLRRAALGRAQYGVCQADLQQQFAASLGWPRPGRGGADRRQKGWRRTSAGRSGAVIGVVGHDGPGTVELFGQQHTYLRSCRSASDRRNRPSQEALRAASRLSGPPTRRKTSSPPARHFRAAATATVVRGAAALSSAMRSTPGSSAVSMRASAAHHLRRRCRWCVGLDLRAQFERAAGGQAFGVVIPGGFDPGRAWVLTAATMSFHRPVGYSAGAGMAGRRFGQQFDAYRLKRAHENVHLR